VTVQPPDSHPFIEDILADMQQTIRHLATGQIHVFYEAVGEIIQVETDPNKRQQLVFKLMELPNQTWAALIATANHDAQTLFDMNTVKRSEHIHTHTVTLPITSLISYLAACNFVRMVCYSCVYVMDRFIC
jgi:exportin-1